MRKVRICPQTRFCGLEMSTLCAVYNKVGREKDQKVNKSSELDLLAFSQPICGFLLLQNKSPHFLIKYVRKLGLQICAFSHV